MRLVRFLAAGKSLVGLKDLVGRYQLPTGRTLPQFGSTKDAAGSTLPENARQAFLPDSKGMVEGCAKEADAASQTPQIAAQPSFGPTMPAPNPKPVEPRRERRTLMRGLFGWLPWYRDTTTRRAIPAFSKLPIQTELSLDNVKVARNDLSESDLDFRPTKVGKAAASVAGAQVSEAGNPVGVAVGAPETEEKSPGS
jgi:hypothetical protein